MLLATLMVACGSPESSGGDRWGEEAVPFFDGLAHAYTENDYYGVLDFYNVEAFVELWRGDIRGGALVRDFLQWNSGDLGHSVRATYLGWGGALTLVEWERSGGLSAIHAGIEEGLIADAVVFDQGTWLEHGLRSSADVIGTYEELYERYADLWSGEDGAEVRDLYHPDAVLEDPLTGRDIKGAGKLTDTLGWAASVETMELSSTTVTGPRSGPAVFQGPAETGADPERAVGLYEVVNAEGCPGQLAVLWQLTGGRITAEQRFWEVGSFDECGSHLPEGWWSGLGLPGPSDERMTGLIETIDGFLIDVHNGTPVLEELVVSGLDRFADAGLERPRLDSVTFEPSRRCEARSGRLLQDEASRDIFLCIFESDICPGDGECVEPSLGLVSNVLHELGHAWILDNVGAEARDQLLEISGRRVWDDLDVPWSERGVEYAAEVIAWGLLPDPPPMVRIGRPPCRELELAFQALTQADPLVRAGTCAAT